MQALRTLLRFNQRSLFILKSNVFTYIISIIVYYVLLYVHIFYTLMSSRFHTNSVLDNIFMNGWTYTIYQRCHNICSVASQMFHIGCPINNTMALPRNSWITLTSKLICGTISWFQFFITKCSCFFSFTNICLCSVKTPGLQLSQLVNTATYFADLIVADSGKCSWYEKISCQSP